MNVDFLTCYSNMAPTVLRPMRSTQVQCIPLDHDQVPAYNGKPLIGGTTFGDHQTPADTYNTTQSNHQKLF